MDSFFVRKACLLYKREYHEASPPQKIFQFGLIYSLFWGLFLLVIVANALFSYIY